tara:strand:+ start:4529 stop:4783 length:255 start_codon:yes stop_codon:yes gene_type:complete
MWNYHAEEEAQFTITTESEWDRAEAYELGARSPDVAWVLTDRDVWHRNPYYSGPPQRHPEDPPEDWGYEDEEEQPYYGPLDGLI